MNDLDQEEMEKTLELEEEWYPLNRIDRERLESERFESFILGGSIMCAGIFWLCVAVEVAHHLLGWF